MFDSEENFAHRRAQGLDEAGRPREGAYDPTTRTLDPIAVYEGLLAKREAEIDRLRDTIDSHAGQCDAGAAEIERLRIGLRNIYEVVDAVREVTTDPTSAKPSHEEVR